MHNKALSSLLFKMQRQVKGFKFSLFDMNKSLRLRMHHPSKFGKWFYIVNYGGFIFQFQTYLEFSLKIQLNSIFTMLYYFVINEKGLKKGKKHVVEQGSGEVYSAVEGRELWRNINYVKILMIIYFGIHFILPKILTNNLQSWFGMVGICQIL